MTKYSDDGMINTGHFCIRRNGKPISPLPLPRIAAVFRDSWQHEFKRRIQSYSHERDEKF